MRRVVAIGLLWGVTTAPAAVAADFVTITVKPAAEWPPSNTNQPPRVITKRIDRAEIIMTQITEVPTTKQIVIGWRFRVPAGSSVECLTLQAALDVEKALQSGGPTTLDVTGKCTLPQ